MADELIKFQAARNRFESSDGSIHITWDAAVDGFRVQGLGGGGSGVFVPSDQVFATNAARDTFFGANPDRLESAPWCMVGGALQMWTGAEWTSGTVAIQGPQGTPGTNGTNGINGTNGTNGQDGQDGQDGREVEITVTSGYIAWRYAGGVSWNNLVDVASLRGQDGTNGTNGTDGADGADGTDGNDGETPQLRVENGVLQYKFPSEDYWTGLYEFPAGGGGGIIDAPQDGEIYGRKDGGWVIVPEGGSGDVSSVTAGGGETLIAVDNTDSANPIISSTQTLQTAVEKADDAQPALSQQQLDNIDAVPDKANAATTAASLLALANGKENVLTAGANITIDRADPANPVISAAGGNGGSIDNPVDLISGDPNNAIVQGTDDKLFVPVGASGGDVSTVTVDSGETLVAVDNTDPSNPVISSTEVLQDAVTAANSALQDDPQDPFVKTSELPDTSEFIKKSDLAPLNRFFVDTNFAGTLRNGSDTFPFISIQECADWVHNNNITECHCIIKAGSDCSAENVDITGVTKVIIEAPVAERVYMVKLGSVTITGNNVQAGLIGLDILGNSTTTIGAGTLTLKNCTLHGGVIDVIDDGAEITFINCSSDGDVTIGGTGAGVLYMITCQSHPAVAGDFSTLATLTINNPNFQLIMDSSFLIAVNLMQGSGALFNTSVNHPSATTGNYAIRVDDNYLGKVDLLSGSCTNLATGQRAPIYIGENCSFSLGTYIYDKETSSLKGTNVTTGLMAGQLKVYIPQHGYTPVIHSDVALDFGQRSTPDTILDNLSGISDEFMKRTLDANDDGIVMNGVINPDGTKASGGIRFAMTWVDDNNVIDNDPQSPTYGEVIGTDAVLYNKNNVEVYRIPKYRKPNAPQTSVDFVNSQTVNWTGGDSEKSANVVVDNNAGLVVGGNGVSVDPNYKIPTAADTNKLTELPTNANLTAALNAKQPLAPAGYGFSENSYTTAEQVKLASIPTPSTLATTDSNGRVADSAMLGGVAAASYATQTWVNNNAVVITGNQTIAGRKTFTSSPQVTISGTNRVVFAGYVSGTTLYLQSN